MAQRGTIKIEEFEWRGTKYPIMLNKNTGEFHVHIPNPDSSEEHRRGPLETFRGDLTTVKEKLEKYLKDADAKLEWKPVILVKHERVSTWSRRSEHGIDLDYTRGFRAKTPAGRTFWRAFNNDKDEVDLKMATYNSDPPYYAAAAIELAYTPERWSSLRLITESMRAMNERLQAIIEGGADEVSHMLHGIAEKGAQLLLPAPKEGGR